MYQTTVKIEGMACGMCESHINDAIRRAFPSAKKVSSSHKKKTSIFFTEEPVEPSEVKAAIEATGYQYLSSESRYCEKKKGLFRRS
jgi:copper chaperone